MPDRRRRRVAVAAAAIALVAAVAVAATLIGGSTRHPAARTVAPLGTAVVTRTDLVSTDHFHGLLAYGARETVHPDGGGTVTSLPRVGQVMSRGSIAWGIDDEPVGVLFGATPLFRTLAVRDPTAATLGVQDARAGLLGAQADLAAVGGSRRGGAARAARLAQAQVSVAEARIRLGDAELALQRTQAPQRGADVALVAENMSALGYADGPTDTWGPSLQAAVAHWQQHLGAPANGRITPTDVLVVPGPERVGAVQGHVGDPASAVAVSLTSPDRVATFEIRGGVPPALAVGRRVRLSAAGRIARGRVASVTSGHGAATVVIDFAQSSPLAGLTSTRVGLSITTSDRHGVLVVPVQSLVALASGGYALQLPGGRLIAVRTGTEQDERIEVSGAGVRPGLRVVTVT